MNHKEQQSAMYVKCDEGDYSSISPQAADLLLAISNCQQRYLLFMHKKSLLHKAMNLSVEDLVTVCVPNNPEVEAVVKYRGPLKDCVGIFFGVQLKVTWFTVCITKL